MLGSRILYLKGMRLMMFQLSGFCYIWFLTGALSGQYSVLQQSGCLVSETPKSVESGTGSGFQVHPTPALTST